MRMAPEAVPAALPTAILAAALTAMLSVLLWAATPALAMVDPRVDRAYGYLLGDIITADATVTVPAGATLDPASLPQTGRVNGWLHLLSVDARPVGDQWSLQRRFLVTASADTVKLIWLPRVELRFQEAGGAGDPSSTAERTEGIDTVAVAISPITAESAFTRNGLGEMRPDRPPPRPDLARIDRGLQFAVVVLLLAGSIAILLPLRERRHGAGAPFRAAARELSALARRGALQAEDLARGYRALHRAFDQFAGQTLLSADIDDFLNRHPVMDGRRDDIRNFYVRSDARFFATVRREAAQGGTMTGGCRDELKALRDLARQLAGAAR